jgi:hypothetical protein
MLHNVKYLTKYDKYLLYYELYGLNLRKNKSGYE